MSQISIPISANMASVIAETQTTAANVNVRKGLPVIAGTAQNQIKPIPTNTTTMLTTIIGIAQDDGNDGDVVRMAVPGQTAIARIKGTGSRGDFLICKTGSTTDAENGSLEVRTISGVANGDLLIGRLLEDATDQSYVKITVLMIIQTAA